MTDDTPSLHMTPEQFREEGRRMVDLIADYWAGIESRPVRSDAEPGQILGALPKSAPDEPEGADAWDAIHKDLMRLIIPGLTHWQHPGFMAYFPCSASGPAILGELLSAGLNVNGMLWATSPAATELETRVVEWCRELFGLPEAFRENGVIQGTASEATLCALVAARARLREAGAGRGFRVYCSDQAHSSVAKAAMIAGIAEGPDDPRHIGLVPTDAVGAIDAHALGRMLRDDLRSADGPAPLAVVCTAGTTGVGAFDPVREVAGAIEGLIPHPARRPWVHIDAAWAGPAAVCPEHRDVLAGAGVADSVCVNPHKWMLTNFDCDLFWVRDRASLVSALSVTPEYLRNDASDAGAVIDYRDWQVPLGRRMRSLKLWFVLRHYGAEGIRTHIQRHIAWARWLEERLLGDERFETLAPRSLSLVTFALRAGDGPTRALMERVNAGGRYLLSHTSFRGRYLIRVALGSTTTEFRHVEGLWEELDKGAAEVE